MTLFTVLGATPALAAGTPAGTDIVNQATATYDVGPTTVTQTSNVTITRVAELLEVSVVWQDAGNVLVAPGDTSAVLTFGVTNAGNGSDSYLLTGLSVLPGDDFDPTLGNLHLDTNGNGIYEPGTDLLYVPGSNDPVLAADSSITVFVLNDIPAAVADADLGNSRLTAASRTGTGTPGTAIAGAGENGTDAVIGTGGGTAEDTGTYEVSSVTVSMIKTVSISDPWGGTEPVPGATLTYSIDVDVVGSGTADSVVVTDPVPANTTYSPGTLSLDTVALTDAADADVGDVGATTPGTVTVFLGSLTSSSGTRTVQFRVTID